MEKSRITSTINPQNQFSIVNGKRTTMHFQESSHQIVNLGHAYSHYLFSFNFFSKTNLHNSINNQFFMKKILNFKNKKHND